MDLILQDVVKCGIGWDVCWLGCLDLVGKIGIINDQVDVWFFGYFLVLVVIVWVGFDNLVLLGNGEYGGCVVLFIWIDYMGVVLDGVEEIQLL